MKTYTTNLPFSWKNMLRLTILVSSLVFLFTDNVQATHIVGGDLTYQCLGNNQYRIRLTVRRDCLLGAIEAPFDNPASIGLFDPVTFQRLEMLGYPQGQFKIAFNDTDTLNEILHSDCSVVMG